MALTQANRFIGLETPLGGDVLAVRNASCREEISRLFQIELDIVSTEGTVTFEDIIGESVTLRLNAGKDQKRYFNGIVSRFVQTKNEGRYAHYRATVVPWLWLLTRTSDCRIFQKKSIPDIIEEVFKAHGFDQYTLSLSGSYQPWDYCVQYRETDFNFVSRLMEQEGMYYFFEHEDGKHTLVLADSPSAHCPNSGYETVIYRPPTDNHPFDRECVTDWVLEKQLRPGAYALNDFNFEKPKVSLLAKSTIDRSHAAAAFEVYDYPGEYEEHGEGESYTKVRIQELQADHETCHAQGTARGLCPGFLFTLQDHPRDDQNREYLITSVSCQMDAGDFESSADNEFFACNFTAIDCTTPFRPARTTPKPLIQGPQTAIVVGPAGEEIHTEAQARVKVQFHWDRYGKKDENSSCWVRVSQPWAGKGWGSMATPRIGQEVIVEFLEGDPDRPIITGRVYNADQPPPYAGGQGVVSGLKSNTHKGSGYNEMSMDDTAGKEKITIHGQYDMNTTVEHDQTTTVHNNRTDKIDVDDSETVGANQTGTVGGNQTLSVAKDRTRTVSKNETVTVSLTRTHTVGVNEAITVGVAQEITVGAAQTITVGANQSSTIGKNQTNSIAKDQSNTIGANQTSKVGKDRQTEVGKNDTLKVAKTLAIEAGDEVLIKTGEASIHMKKDGTIQIKGKDITVQGSGEINQKASKNITMKGQKILQN
jgi:type VI secretion system secreted protein VgrG